MHKVPGSWDRLYWPDVVAWARSKRVPPSNHAERRVAEVLEHEARRAHEAEG